MRASVFAAHARKQKLRRDLLGAAPALAFPLGTQAKRLDHAANPKVLRVGLAGNLDNRI